MCYFRHVSINIKDKTTRVVQLYWGEQVVSCAVVAISSLRSLSCSFLCFQCLASLFMRKKCIKLYANSLSFSPLQFSVNMHHTSNSRKMIYPICLPGKLLLSSILNSHPRIHHFHLHIANSSAATEFCHIYLSPHKASYTYPKSPVFLIS